MADTTITFTCPVTAQRGRSTVPSDTGLQIQDLDPDNYLPEGWGAFRLSRVVANPDLPAVEAKRREAREQVEAAAETDGPEQAAAREALANLDVLLDQTLPLPEPLVAEVIEWPHVSPEGLNAIVRALVAANVLKGD